MDNNNSYNYQQPYYGEPSYQQPHRHQTYEQPGLETSYDEERPQQQPQQQYQPVTTYQGKILPYETEINEVDRHQYQQQPPPHYTNYPTNAPAPAPFEPVPLNNNNNINSSEKPQYGNATDNGYPTAVPSRGPSTFSRHPKRWIISAVIIVVLIIALGAGLGAGLKHHSSSSSSSSSSSHGGGNSCVPPGGQQCDSSGDCFNYDSQCIMACNGFSYCT